MLTYSWFRKGARMTNALLTVVVFAALTLGASAQPDLIARDALFGNPERALVQISPDGSQLSYIAPVDGVLNVWVGPADDPDAAQPITQDTERGIIDYGWAHTGRHILYSRDSGGDENTHVYVVDLESGETTDLTPYDGVQARIEQLSYLHPEEALLAVNNRNPMLHDIYRVNLLTGESQMVVENPGFLGYVTTLELEAVMGVTFSPDGGIVVVDITGEEPKPVLGYGAEDIMTTSPISLSPDGRTLYLIDSRGRDKAAFCSMDLDSGEVTVIAEDPRADIGDGMMHPTERTPQAYNVNYLRSEWHGLTEDVQESIDFLASRLSGDFSVASRTTDDSKWIVAHDSPERPVEYYLLDRDAEALDYLFSIRSELENAPLASLEGLVLTTRDGLDMPAYLTLPTGVATDEHGLPVEPLPLVLWVHGGPWSREGWGYHPIHQWLANRGYAVLAPQFRGSTGFGKGYINASNREWGGTMHQDLLDAVQWAIDEGIADPERVAIMGGSYGGYSTLVGVTMTPDVFCCGVDLVGPANLVTWMENIPPYWVPMLPLLKDRVGDYESEEGREFLMSRSPITYVDQISVPLLVGQGANDPRVVRGESDQIVETMEAKGIPVTYLVYPDEGHGFVREPNSLSFWAVTEAFLAEHLGGRMEPIGDDLEGSSMEVITGAEQIPGLEEALGEG
jgi:dipeptidyl aminopeptidase/acylaminoacyl peptidase